MSICIVAAGCQICGSWSRAPNSKLTPDRVRDIRRLVAEGQSRRSVARIFGVSDTAVNRIISGKTWSHVVG